MATHWVDLKLGNDSTGDGTYALPYRTINKAIAVAATTDEIKVYETDNHTTVVGDVTFTVHSTTLNTTSDLTGSLSVGDWIGKENAAGNGAEEHYYRINAITATTITLENRYYGESETVSSVIKLYIETNNESDHVIDYDRTLALDISGGWDSETTQDGETWVTTSAARTSSSQLCCNLAAGGGFTLTNMNFAEVYGVHIGVQSASFNDCTFLIYYRAGISAGNISYTGCCLSSPTTSYWFSASTYTLTDSFFFGTVNNGYVGRANVSNKPITSIRSKFYGFTYVFSTLIYSCTFSWEDCEMWYCTYGIFGPTSGTAIESIDFYNCTAGVNLAGSSGALIRNCQMTDCTYGVYSASGTSQNYIENCTFTNCDRGIYFTDSRSGSATIVSNCSFESPTTYGIQISNDAPGPISITNCSIDTPSASKLFYNPTINENGYVPRFILENNNVDDYFPSGSYYGYYAVVIDDEASGFPILKVTNRTTWYYFNLGAKVFSTYVKTNNGKKITFRYKHDAGWAGKIVITALLNGAKIKEFTDDEIILVNTGWVEVELTLLDGEITQDGELSIHIGPNGNTTPWRIQFTNVEDA